MRLAALIACCWLGSVQCAGQDSLLYVYGSVRTYENKDSIPFPRVRVQEKGVPDLPSPVRSTALGRYELELNKQGIFWILFDAPGKVGKRIEIDTRGARSERIGGYGMNVDVTLFDSIPGLDFSILNEPMGRACFVGTKDEFNWDLAYTQAMRERIAKMLKAYDDSRKRTIAPLR